MSKRICITIDDECVEILEKLISKPSKSIFVQMALKSFAESEAGKKFLYTDKDLKNVVKKEKTSRKENHFLPENKKVKIQEWS